MPTKYIRRLWSGNLHYDLLRDDEQPLTLSNFVFAAIIVAACVGMVMVAHDADDVNAAAHARLAKQEKALQALKGDARKAYEQGLVDGVQGLQGTPQGVELAQACIASGLVVAK